MGITLVMYVTQYKQLQIQSKKDLKTATKLKEILHNTTLYCTWVSVHLFDFHALVDKFRNEPKVPYSVLIKAEVLKMTVV